MNAIDFPLPQELFLASSFSQFLLQVLRQFLP